MIYPELIKCARAAYLIIKFSPFYDTIVHIVNQGKLNGRRVVRGILLAAKSTNKI